MNRRSQAINLLQAAQAEFDSEVLPELTGRQRYAGAMIRRTLSVIQRDLARQSEDPEQALLQTMYGGDTDHDMSELARDIRARRIDRSPTLAQALTAYVEHQLVINNPQFLKTAQEDTSGLS